MKETAVDNLHMSAATIVDSVLLTTDLSKPVELPKKDNLVRIANRRREGLRPKHPAKDDNAFEVTILNNLCCRIELLDYIYYLLLFQLLTNALPDAAFVQKDILHDGQRHIILAASQQLHLLSQWKT